MATHGLVPELLVRDIEASLDFWCRLCGFTVRYDRPEHGFAYLDRGPGVSVMLDHIGINRDWVTAPLEPPLGRGINLEVTVASLEPILAALEGAGWPLYLAPETKSYRVGTGAVTVRQFLVQDPDGYLLRFAQEIEG